METINDRIQFLIDQLFGGKAAELCRVADIPPSTLSSIIGERQSKPSVDVLNKIYNAIADSKYTLLWLLTGSDSKMTSPRQPRPEIVKLPVVQETRPRIPMNAAAGSISSALAGVKSENCEHLPVIQAFSRYSYTLFVKGDSMEPEFHSGDELACLQITNNSFVQWGRYHVLDTSQGVVVKRIYEDGEYILCKSEASDLYKDFRIHKEEIYNIALVVGMLRRF
ncbi:MAG: S24 family peptidase [Tannerellaceae bacterium]|nr:S24 family peptidase [Tannerellaceae bacterium]